MKKTILFSFIIFTLCSQMGKAQALADSSKALTAVNNTYPTVSPDGKTILFSSDRDGDLDLYTMNADGRGFHQITDLPGNEGHPDFSPDGTKITFYATVGKVEEDLYEIYVADIDGSNLRRLTNYNHYTFHPKFTPDGKRILYNRQVPSGEDRYEFFEIDLETGKQTKILSDEKNITFASYSPDGTKLAFVKWLGLPEVFILDVATGDQINISNHDLFDGWPAWSPDGSKIVFASDREEQRKFDLFLYDLSSKTISKVTEGEGGNVQPAWFPDGNRIVNTKGLNGVNNLVIQYLSDQ